MLRTAMCSTRANRNYGPPDGIQPEFDLLLMPTAFAVGDAYCIGHSCWRLQSKLAALSRGHKGVKRYIIILVRERQTTREISRSLKKRQEQSLCRRARYTVEANVVPTHFLCRE